jgi:transposase
MDTSDQAPVNTQASKRPRQMRTNEEKRRIVEETMVPGTSLASVALKHGVNANLLFSWRRLHRRGLLAQSREPAALLPVTVTTSTPPHPRRKHPISYRS